MKNRAINWCHFSGLVLSHQLPQLSAYVINIAAAILCPHRIAVVADITVKGGVKGKACSEWIWKNRGGEMLLLEL